MAAAGRPALAALQEKVGLPSGPSPGGAHGVCLHCNAPPPCRGAAGGRAQGAARSGCLGCGRMASARGGRQHRSRPRPAAARRAGAVPVGNGAPAGPIPHCGAPQRARLARTPLVQLPGRPLHARVPRRLAGERRRHCRSAPRPAAALRVSTRGVVTARPLPAETRLEAAQPGSLRLPAPPPHAPPAPEHSNCRLSRPLRRDAHKCARRRDGFVLSGAATERRAPAPPASQGRLGRVGTEPYPMPYTEPRRAAPHGRAAGGVLAAVRGG
jgi:hypothetical protein